MLRRGAGRRPTTGTSTRAPLRIAVIASTRYPIAQPFAGGLESHVWHLARELRRRGHAVTLFAADGSDPEVGAEVIVPPLLDLSPHARRDVSMPPEWVMAEHHAYLSLMTSLASDRAGSFDVVHNHSLHHLPLAMAPAVRTPMLTTLHTPPTPWLESAWQISGAVAHHRFAAVSGHTAEVWHRTTGPIEVVPNGVDLDGWPVGPGGGPAIWFGRLVPEKGADLAIAAARHAGRELWLAGPPSDREWFERVVEPHLGNGVTHLGHLSRAELAARVGEASVSLVTPRWDEPYGLVVAESLACGTPVVALARGGVPEILDASSGVLVDSESPVALAAAWDRALGLSRADCRLRAETACSLDAMTDRYEAIYARLATARAA